jgi:hypothetical protein
MFNLYYINYAKAFEIAMQIDNKLLEKQVVDSASDKNGEGSMGIETPTGSFLSRLIPTLSGEVKFAMSKSDKTSDTLKVVSTKSTILDPIIQKAVEIKKIGDDRIGKLIKIKDVNLTVENASDILASKVLLSGILKNVPVEGLGNVDMTELMDVMLKGASYIAIGKIPGKIKQNEKTSDKLIIKIPIEMGNEMESQYSISDLEIGSVTIIGIYRGVFKYSNIKAKDEIMGQLDDNESEIDIESERQELNGESNSLNDNDMLHFIDVIAIVQDLYF